MRYGEEPLELLSSTNDHKVGKKEQSGRHHSSKSEYA